MSWVPNDQNQTNIVLRIENPSRNSYTGKENWNLEDKGIKEVYYYRKLPWWLRRWSTHLQCRRPGFAPWAGKIPWRRKWQPTPLFLPGKSHGQRSLVGCSPWGHKELGTTEWLTLSTLCKLKRCLFCKNAILITVCSCSKNISLIFEINCE